MKDHYEVLIVGGGSGGITAGAWLRNEPEPLTVGIIEPSTKHYYQPLWTLVGGGVFPKEVTEREEGDLIPPGADWIQDYVERFDPDNNQVTLRSGKTIGYDNLIVAAGIQLDWDAIPGLAESVGKPGTGVCSNYSYETVDSTWECVRNLKGGRAIFTHPDSSIKCGGAPQKICYLAEDYWRKNDVRDHIEVVFAKAGGAIFGVDKYTRALEKVVERKGIETMFHQDLVELKPERREAVFKDVQTGALNTVNYDMIHVTPKMSAPDFIKQSPLANADGWVDVDKYTLQHNTYPNVWALGDCSSLPTAKTGAGIRKQAPILVQNLLAFNAGEALPKTYNGYTSCPLITGYGSLILAEFDYNDEPAETFPFDQSQERYSMYALKVYGLPQIYWHGMLRGRA